MRVLQLIDSLNAGGAERVAVNLANGLSNKIDKSFLCTTREEGLLKENLLNTVDYLFLNKTKTIDFGAIKKLNSFIKEAKIDIVHAHSSSFFLATIIKILNPKLILLWHEHYGNRKETPFFNKLILKICSYFFSCIITVNDSLKNWSENKLLTKSVYVLPNYPVINTSLKRTKLQGEEGKRIICLANLRPDKDHLNLLRAFNQVCKNKPNWTLHLIGQFYNDEYYSLVKNFIENKNLEKHVFIYGSCSDTFNILSQANIGVLASKSEGLPLALLEYGLSGLPVIITNVGDCKKVVSNSNEGVLVEAKNDKVFAEALLSLINNLELSNALGENLKIKVLTSFSEVSVLKKLIEIYNNQKK